nr:transposase family protein [Streptomyces cadmiisoli]
MNDVAGRLSVLRDPRDRRGRRHSLGSVLLTACCAVLAGARSCLAVGQWARHAPLDALARLGVRACGPLGVRRAPSTSTIRRLLTLVCPGGLADLLGCDPLAAGTWPWTARPPAARVRTPDRPPTCSPPSWTADAPSASYACRTRPPRSPASRSCRPRSTWPVSW